MLAKIEIIIASYWQGGMRQRYAHGYGKIGETYSTTPEQHTQH